MKRGEIRNLEYFKKARAYSWSRCEKYAPRGIMPTDIDFAIECRGKFLFFEMKTEGSRMPIGQKIFFETLLASLPEKSLLMVTTHLDLEIPTIPDDITGIETWYPSKTGLKRKIHDGNLHRRFVSLYAGFFEWAERTYMRAK